MRVIVCDKCGNDDLAPLRPEWFSVEVRLPDGHKHVDLCKRCQARLKGWLSDRDPVALVEREVVGA